MAIDITSETYRLTKTLPRSERYGLVQQMTGHLFRSPSTLPKAQGGAIVVTLHDVCVLHGVLRVSLRPKQLWRPESDF